MREIIENVTGKSTVTPDELAEVIAGIHHTPEDLYQGDLSHRLHKFTRYDLVDLPLDEINLDEWQRNDAMVRNYALRMQSGEDYPPIVFDLDAGSIIDGTHRANAAAWLDWPSIRAYVGRPEHIDPEWTEELELEEGRKRRRWRKRRTNFTYPFVAYGWYGGAVDGEGGEGGDGGGE